MIAVALAGLLLQAANQLTTYGPVPADGVRILLVRHGEAWKNLGVPGLSPAKEDLLTKGGEQQSAALARAIAAVHPSAVFHSPTNRTKQTATAIAAASPDAGAPVVSEAIRTQDAPKESFAQVAERVDAFVRELAAARPGQQVVLVAHSEVIGSYLMKLSGADKPSGPRLGSITVVDVRPGEEKPVVHSVDYVP